MEKNKKKELDKTRLFLLMLMSIFITLAIIIFYIISIPLNNIKPKENNTEPIKPHMSPLS